MKKRLIALVIIFLVIILLYLSSYPFGCREREEIVVIGLDGGSWDVIAPMIKEGKLPNLGKFMQEGVYGGLSSDETLDTPMVWNYITTGNRDNKSESKKMWEIASEADRVVGTSYWPSTDRTTGFMIPPYYEIEKEYFPSDIYNDKARFLLKSTAIEFIRKSYYMKIFIPSDRLDKDILYDFYLLDYKSREFFYLRDRFKPDVSAIIFYGPDRLQHYLWMYAFPDKFQNVDEEKIKKYGNIIEEYYKHFDKFVGRIMTCNKDATVFIISGYGFDATVPPKIVDEILVNNIIEKMGLLKFDYRGEMDIVNTKLYAVEDEMEKSVFVKIADDSAKNQAIDLFSNIRLEGSSQNVFLVIETDQGIILERNIPLKLSDENIIILDNVYTLEDFVYRRVISGRRTNTGIFLAHGKNIEKGKSVYGAKIEDVAPTILHLFNITLKNIKGRVLSEIFV